MTPPRFQFTIKGMLVATFFAALGCTTWAFAMSDEFKLRHTPNWYALAGLGILFPSIAVGALFNRPLAGFALGVGLAIVAWLTLVMPVIRQ